MLNTIRHIIRKEFIQTFRDKRMLIPIFIAPIIQLTLFGFAVTTDIKHIFLASLDYDRSQESRQLVAAFINSGYFDLKSELGSFREADDLVQQGKIQAALIIPEKFGSNLRDGRKTSLQLILDGTDSNSAIIVQNYASLITAKYSENILTEVLDGRPGGLILPEPRIWYNPELKSAYYMVPAVICLILLITTLVLTAMSITKEREVGTLEQLMVSPIKTWELILGKIIPFVVIGLTDVGLIILAGKIIFGIPIRGSLLLLIGSSFLFIMTTLSLGLFVSTISRTQQQAMMTAFFMLMPAMLLSGIFSPIESMPRAIQYITYLNPLRYFSRILREIFLKGNDLSVLWEQNLALLIFGIVALTLSSLRFKKHLE